MAHHISALVIAGPYDHDRALALDLRPRLAHPPVTLFAIDHRYAAYWQARRGRSGVLFPPDTSPAPDQAVLADLVREIAPTSPGFAVIYTEYFGGDGEQWAGVIEGDAYVPVGSVNEALRRLGVIATDGRDEWDTIGLASFRAPPEHLARYVELLAELGG